MFGWFEMALTDQDLTAPATDSALRVKEFLKQAEGDTIQVDDQLKQMARKALETPKTWELVMWQILELVPQVDRVCITTVDGDKLRLKVVQDRIGLKTPFHSTSTVAKAEGDALADYALGDKVVVNDSMANVKGPTMNKMARKDIRSSMHVPVQIDGQRCTVNFWSTEDAGFPAAGSTDSRTDRATRGRGVTGEVAAQKHIQVDRHASAPCVALSGRAGHAFARSRLRLEAPRAAAELSRRR